MTDDKLQTMEQMVATSKKLKDRIATLEHFARISDQEGEWTLNFRPAKANGEFYVELSRHAEQLQSLIRNELGFTKAAFQGLDMQQEDKE